MKQNLTRKPIIKIRAVMPVTEKKPIIFFQLPANNLMVFKSGLGLEKVVMLHH